MATALAPSSPEWECVVWFYSALHLVQAYLLTKNERFGANNHVERDKAIQRCTELKGRFVPAYRGLRDLSEQARYDAGYQVRPVDQERAREYALVIKSFLESKLERKLGPSAN